MTNKATYHTYLYCYYSENDCMMPVNTTSFSSIITQFAYH